MITRVLSGLVLLVLASLVQAGQVNESAPSDYHHAFSLALPARQGARIDYGCRDDWRETGLPGRCYIRNATVGWMLGYGMPGVRNAGEYITFSLRELQYRDYFGDGPKVLQSAAFREANTFANWARNADTLPVSGDGRPVRGPECWSGYYGGFLFLLPGATVAEGTLSDRAGYATDNAFLQARLVQPEAIVWAAMVRASQRYHLPLDLYFHPGDENPKLSHYEPRWPECMIRGLAFTDRDPQGAASGMPRPLAPAHAGKAAGFCSRGTEACRDSDPGNDPPDGACEGGARYFQCLANASRIGDVRGHAEAAQVSAIRLDESRHRVLFTLSRLSSPATRLEGLDRDCGSGDEAGYIGFSYTEMLPSVVSLWMDLLLESYAAKKPVDIAYNQEQGRCVFAGIKS